VIGDGDDAQVGAVGDGNNLKYVAQFEHVPDDFAEGVTRALYPTGCEEKVYGAQREQLVALIDGVEALVERVAPEEARD